METAHPPQLLEYLECESRMLHPGLLPLVEERLRALDPASADPGSAAELLGLLASVLQNVCTGNVAADYVDGPQGAMQDSVRLASAMVSWMAQGGVTAVASSSPETCSNLKDFIAAALDLASHAFFSNEWYHQLGPARYVQAGNAVRGYVRDLAPAALDATEACWRAVEQQLAVGDTTAEELLEACRVLFGALFEGLRHLGTTSAERINDPAVPREMRSFAGLNILWTGLSRLLTTLPPAALQQLLAGCAVQSVLRALLGYLAAEVRAMVASPPNEYDTRLKVSRFWLQHAGRVAQAHPAAAAACWDELAATAVEVYDRIATAGYAAAAAAATAMAEQQGSATQEQLQAQMARDLNAAIAVKLTSLLAVVLDAGTAEEEEGGPGGAAVAVVHAASPKQIEARLAKLEVLAAAASAPWVAAAGAEEAAGPAPPAGAVLLCLALLQRAVHVSPEARAVMASRSLPWAGVATAVQLYNVALEQCGPRAAAPCLDLPHQLAAAALTLLAAAAELQGGCGGQASGQDVDTFAAGCAVVCNWGTCAHPILAAAAGDVLSTLVQHCEPQLAVRLIAAVAQLACMAAAAEAAAEAIGYPARGCGGGVAAGEAAAAAFGGGVGGRLERLLVSMLTAASPEAELAWWEVLQQLAPLPAQSHEAVGPFGNGDFNGFGTSHDSNGGGGSQQCPGLSLDLCGAARARILWGAAAGVAAVQAAAAARGGETFSVGGGGVASVSEQDLGDRARLLLAAVRQAAAVLGSCKAGSGGGAAGASPAVASAAMPTPLPVSLARQWLSQLVAWLEVTVAHIRHVGASGLKPLVSEAAELAAEMLKVFCPEPFLGSGCAAVNDGAVDVAAAHAVARLVARAADCMNPTALAAAVPALTWLAQRGSPAAVADVAAAAAYCNSPPPEALFHALLRSPHPVVIHAALQSQVHVCRTVPQQYAASVRRLFPPDFSPAAGAAAGAAQGQGPPSAQLAAVFKSYMSRKVADEEAAAALAAAPQARAAQGERMAVAAREGCAGVAALGRPAAPPALRGAVARSAEAMQACVGALASAQTDDGGFGSESGHLALDPADGALDSFGSGGGGGPLQQQHHPLPNAQLLRQHSQPQLAAGGSVGAAAGGGGPLTPLVADDNAAMGGLKAALGGLERSLGALHATVVAQGINKGRPADWDQLQAHVRALLGDLSSATARIRNMNELLYALQGR